MRGSTDGEREHFSVARNVVKRKDPFLVTRILTQRMYIVRHIYCSKGTCLPLQLNHHPRHRDTHIFLSISRVGR